MGLFSACPLFSIKFSEPQNVQKRKGKSRVPKRAQIYLGEKGMKISLFRDPINIIYQIKKCPLTDNAS